ncbi:amino acid adenylation domain-containing protein [Streptomyces sp. NPDC041068]|uniref:amino acid adenylation domain-containing protein n=1 Tax=Streptomyces sp. NPDC041068 TaxID=3155130 RepID=UPI0033D2D493
MLTLRTHDQGEQGREGEARHCHALRVRLAAADTVDAGSFAPAAGRPRLWRQRVPAASTEPEAVRRLELEMARPVTAARGVRAVLVDYADGAADLVLVAHRGAYGRRALHELAQALLRGTGPGSLPERGGRTGESRSAVFAPAPAWGLGEPERGPRAPGNSGPAEQWAQNWIALPAGVNGDSAGWLAALAVVLGRYAPEEEPVVAALGAGDDEDVALLPVDLMGSKTLGDVTDALRDLLRTAPTSATPPVTAGLVLALDEAGSRAVEEPQGGGPGGTEGEYVPFLAPPFPLTLTLVREADGGFALRCHYRPRAVCATVASQFVRHLVEVHRQVTATPWLPVADAELYDKPERDRIVQLGRPGQSAGQPAGQHVRHAPHRIDEVFQERVAQRPEALALSDGDTRFTYRELDLWSNRLAHGLREVGVRDGDLVGVCLERSAELVALLLAVLKAGAVYVPLDPAYPAERLAYTVENSGLGVLITALAEIPGRQELRVVTPARLAELGADRADVPPSKATAMDPAYVIYTSGSTGRPKGVLVPHANVLRLLDATRADFGLGPEDVWTFFHSVAFDFSVWEIWGCLLTGGHLVVVPYWASRSPEQFRELLRARGVTVLNQTPSGFAQLVEAERTQAPDLAVRLVVFGGEPLDGRRLLPWLDRYPESRCRLVNMFGITETTVHVTAETFTRAMALAGSRSVGTALPGWYLYVLDGARRPQPPGVAGEIYVGGAGVALGYLRRPELTAERFVPDPFTGGRMYRTGDRGRLRPDGRLEHLGRIDNQVKLRGFRIELGEIRSVLAECPGVDTAVVVLHQDDPEDSATARLDAYVVLSEGSVTGLRERLARRLPEYMLPATITALPELPVTANGKVDLAGLPAPVRIPGPRRAESSGQGPDSSQEGPGQDSSEEGPESDIRTELIDVWSEVFGLPVSASDNFFELGGNSLLAVRMAAVMRERGLPSLHPRTLYLHSTVQALAAELRPSG